MTSLASNSLSLLQAWPRDVISSLHYYGSSLSPSGNAGKSIEKNLASLPPRTLVRKSYGEENSGRAFGMQAIAAGYSTGGYYGICASLMDVLKEADESKKIGFNPVLFRSLLLVRNYFIASSTDTSRSLAECIAPAYAIAAKRDRILPEGHVEKASNLDLLLILVGLEKVCRHPAMSGYDLTGPVPNVRKLRTTVASMSALVLATVITPYLIGKAYSVGAGVGACLVSLSIGGAIIQRNERNRVTSESDEFQGEERVALLKGDSIHLEREITLPA